MITYCPALFLKISVNPTDLHTITLYHLINYHALDLFSTEYCKFLSTCLASHNIILLNNSRVSTNYNIWWYHNLLISL